ncbi:MAG: phosphate-starvation-inducible PsiE family protein [Bacteroidales bacterium]|jgi:uncharacterized membrane protein (DUF373 family)
MRVDYIKKFEKAVFSVLVVILVSYIIVEIIELIYQFSMALIFPEVENGRLMVSAALLKEFLPVFFNILIAIELIDTFSIYYHKHSIKVLNILLIGLIAIGRKLIGFDFGTSSGIENIGLAALIFALAAGYYFIKKDECNEASRGNSSKSISDSNI